MINNVTDVGAACRALDLLMGWSSDSSDDEDELTHPPRVGELPIQELPVQRPVVQPDNNRIDIPEVNDNGESSSDEDDVLSVLLERLNIPVPYGPGERPCKYSNCRTPTTKTYCYFHTSPRCIVDGCQRAQWKEHKCRRHSGYVPPKCSSPGCNNQSKVGGKCYSHGAPIKLCKFSACARRAKFHGMCHTHNPVSGLCIECRLNSVRRKGEKCSHCSRPREFSPEHRILNIVGSWYPSLDMKRNKVLTDRLRPDLVIRLDAGIVICEVDEDSHLAYPVQDEARRMIRLWEGTRTPTVFIRYSTAGADNIREDVRMEELKKLLDSFLARNFKFPPKPAVHFLYYDQERQRELTRLFNHLVELT